MPRAIRLILLLMALTPGMAKRRKSSSVGTNAIQGRKRECDTECASTDEDDRPNCVLRCQSAACYNEIFMPEELEPGEIDMQRQRAFQSCLQKEAQQQRAEAWKSRGAKPQPASQPVADDVAVEL